MQVQDGGRPAITPHCCRAASPSHAQRAKYRPTTPAGTRMAPAQKGGCVTQVPTASSVPFPLFLSLFRALPLFCLCQNGEALGSQVQPTSALFKIVFFSHFFHQNEVFTQLLRTVIVQFCKYLPSTKR